MIRYAIDSGVLTAFSGTGADSVLCAPGNEVVREYAEQNGLAYMGRIGR